MTVEEFIAKWQGTIGGAEKKNLPLFVGDLCALLGVDPPSEPGSGGVLGAYEYEAPVPKGSFRSLGGKGAVDLYKRAHFIMEAKQSHLKPEQAGLDLGEPAGPRAPSGARYDKLMRDARLQAENYAKNLPASEPVAPFLIVCDIGRAFEIYHDAGGNGRGYQFFPDKQCYRVELTDLSSDTKLKGVDCTPLEMLKAIWSDPKSIDPRFQSADVTRTVATRLASVSQYIEEIARLKSKGGSEADKARDVEESALFLMRILFCMFAEDIGLLPKDKFRDFLLRAESNDELFERGLLNLWRNMGQPHLSDRWASAFEEEVRYFNGNLFRETARTYRLSSLTIHDLYEAARQNWRKVEPAIFGTLLEQALTPEERAKLGAHYTPRAYVETLVRATIIDVLEPEWTDIETGPEVEMLDRALAFHERLATVRVLDPACGTGNFLYVSMELMQALESRVIEMIQTLGGEAAPKVGPHQFYGLEKNPRAAKIAELVLWIGWLRNRLHDDPDSVPQPVLAESASINFGLPGRYDAVLALDKLGTPDFENPALPDWPEAEFIVGNPPFIGKGATMRKHLGHQYVEALIVANARVAASADFVMQWWDRSAHLLTRPGSPLIRFGFVTTNKIKQVFNRKVIERWSDENRELVSIVFAIPDHPWYKPKSESVGARKVKRSAKDKTASIRIAMTVAQNGSHTGHLRRVVSESKLDTDDPQLKFDSEYGIIHSNLTVGVDVTKAEELVATSGLSCNGMMLAGKGFKLSRSQAIDMIKEAPDVGNFVRPYVGGNEILSNPKGRYVIDFYGCTESKARNVAPTLYSHLLSTVKKERDKNRRPALKNRWWIFAEPRSTFRPALNDIDRYIATTESSKHRVFQFLNTAVVPDHMIVAIGLDDFYSLGILSSATHLEWTYANCGLLGIARAASTHRYTKSRCFDTFPFPDPTPEQRSRVSNVAEELDATRKLAIAETDKLTMTELYNLRAKLLSGEPMDEKEQRRATKARAAIVDRLHEQLDQAVADAYGWGEEWAAGALGPSEIVARLVALNHERAAEEAAGQIRWLRPEYQIPRFAKPKGK